MAPRKDAGPAPSASQSQQDASSEGIEDFELPRVLVNQLAISALPPDAQLDRNSITALVKGSTVFINYLAAAAQDIAAARAHKTISGADVLKALESLQFGEVVTAFQGELEAFRQGNRTKSKVGVDPKAKSSGSPVDMRPATTQDSVPTFETEGPHAMDISLNGAMDFDVEMQDAGEQGIHNPGVNVTLPIE